MRRRKLLTLEVWESDGGFEVEARGNAVGYHPRHPGRGSAPQICVRKTIDGAAASNLLRAVGRALGRVLDV